MSDGQEVINLRLDNVEKEVSRVQKALWGNGIDGMDQKLDRVVNWIERRDKIEGKIVAGLIILVLVGVGTFLLNLFRAFGDKI